MRDRSRCICLESSIVILSLIVLSFPHASALMGYDIIANVDSSTWSLHRSTMNLTFISDENIKNIENGSGKFSRFSNIQGLAGYAKHESSYSLDGNLDYYIEKIRFFTREGKVIIKANINEYPETNTSQDSEFENINITGSSARITVDERWPSYLIDYKSMNYSGSGIRTKDTYYNNGDEISTSFYSSELKKDSLYRTSVNRTFISAFITPEGVKENRSMNKTSTFSLNSASEGTSANLKFSRSRPYDESDRFGRTAPYILISEDYSGEQEISLKVGMNESAIIPLNDTYQWLPCCNDVNQSFSDVRMDTRDVFDCSCLNRH